MASRDVKDVPILTDVKDGVIWMTRMKDILAVLGLAKYITTPGVDTGVDTEDKQKDEMAMARVRLALDNYFLIFVSDCKNTKETWDTIKDMIKFNSGHQQKDCLASLTALRMDSNEDTTKYFARAKQLFAECAAAELTIPETQIVIAALNGLPEEYTTLVDAILNDSADPTFKSVMPKIRFKEQRILNAGTDEPRAFAARSLDRFSKPSYSPGHSSGQPSSTSSGRQQQHNSPADRNPSNRRKLGKCHYCGKQGHYQAECRKRLAELKYKNELPKAMTALALMATSSDSKPDPNLMILDSGATRHMSSCKQHFIDMQMLDKPILVRYGNDSVSAAVATGTMRIYVQQEFGSPVCEVTLKNALWVPDLAVGALFSVRRTAKNGSMVTFVHDTARINHGRGVIKAWSMPSQGGLYCFSLRPVTADQPAVQPAAMTLAAKTTEPPVRPASADQPAAMPTAQPADQPAAMPTAQPTDQPAVMPTAQPTDQPTDMALVAATVETPELWHRRLNHLSYSSLAKMTKMVNGISITAAQFTAAQQAGPCEPCVLGKQPRQPFPASDSRASAPLELLHTDVMGPLDARSLGGSRYVTTVLDDYSEVATFKGSATKSAAAQFIKDTVIQLEQRLGLKVKTIRSDRGREYVNHNLRDFFRQRGISHETSAPYTPQQNGRAERLNRTIMDRVRSMLVESNLHDNMWSEALRKAACDRNCSPTANSNVTPWERMFGEVPDVSHIRVFGVTAYIHVPKPNRGKLNPVSMKGTFVGYEPDSKAYRVLVNGKICVSRDVVFDETPKQPQPDPLECTRKLPSNDEVIQPQPQPVPQMPVQEHGDDVDVIQLAAQQVQPQPPAQHVQPAAQQVQPQPPAQQVQPQPPAQQVQVPMGRPPRPNRGQLPTRFSDYALSATVVDVEEPLTMQQALSSPQADQWRMAMDDEIASLHGNGTWSLVKLPTSSKAIPVKWVYKLKRDPMSNIVRFKARLVAKGFMQREGVDFDEVYAPVSRHTTMRALLALVATFNLGLHQLDVKTAFLNGELDETIYMQQPPGYEEGDSSTVCLLQRSIYGLRQAPRAWYNKLKQELQAIGFEESDADASLFIKRHEDGDIYLLVYVDDFLVISRNDEHISSTKKQIGTKFEITDMGESKHFLGMEVLRNRDDGTVTLTQRGFINELVAKYGMKDAKFSNTPMAAGTKLVKDPDDLLDPEMSYNYMGLVGSLLYLANCTRPDIAQAVGVLSRFSSSPSPAHYKAAKNVLRYLASTPEYGLNYSKDEGFNLIGYSDADYAGDPQTRRSTTGFVFRCSGGAISWSSRLQPTVATSTMEAEYMAAASATKEALWLRKLFKELGQPVDTIEMMCDNQAALTLIQNPVISPKSKHIDVAHHFVRERTTRLEVKFSYIKTDKMVADIMTKPLPEKQFEMCCKGMGLW